MGIRLTFSTSSPLGVHDASYTKVFARPGGGLTAAGDAVGETEIPGAAWYFLSRYVVPLGCWGVSIRDLPTAQSKVFLPCLSAVSPSRVIAPRGGMSSKYYVRGSSIHKVP